MTTGGQNLVAIGGGTGLSTLLAGLKKRCRKSRRQRLAREPVGDRHRFRRRRQLRSFTRRVADAAAGRHSQLHDCALGRFSLLSRLFRYRFRGDGELGGHSFGNLFLAALTEVTGDFTEAVRLSSEVLASKGHIFPATISDVRLVAELEDGSASSVAKRRSPLPKSRFAVCGWNPNNVCRCRKY